MLKATIGRVRSEGEGVAIDIRKPLKKFLPHLLQAQKENLNEADTSQRITKFFEDVLGYDGLTELTFESHMKNKYVDLALKIDGTVKVLVEVKAAGVVLRDRHIEQAERYASENNFQWALLTNGVVWNLYHLTFEEGIEYERAFSVDLSKDDFEKATTLLGLLHRQSIKKGAHEDFWAHQRTLSPSSLGKAFFAEDVLHTLRRQVRRQEGILVDVEDLAIAVQNMFSAETREQVGPVKVRRRKKRTSAPVPDPSTISMPDSGARGAPS